MNRYSNWSESGYLSSNGACFHIGRTVSAALARYQTTGDPFSGLAVAQERAQRRLAA
jgi:ADP-ribosyl-[dinitrogen reductase] hydrolase